MISKSYRTSWLHAGKYLLEKVIASVYFTATISTYIHNKPFLPSFFAFGQKRLYSCLEFGTRVLGHTSNEPIDVKNCDIWLRFDEKPSDRVITRNGHHS